MASVNHVLEVYQELADWYEQRGQAQMRDRFLVLAADAAQSAGKTEEAERLRQRLLRQNPHHLLKPYASLAEALKAPDVQSYVADLRRSYSPETAEHLRDSLRASAGGPQEEPARPAAPAPKAKEPAKESAEVLKFYRVEEELEEVVPPAVAQRQAPAPRMAPRPAGPAPSPPARPPVSDIPPTQRAPSKMPPRPSPVSTDPLPPPAPNPNPPESEARPSPFATDPLPPPAPNPYPPEREEKEQAPGFWVAYALFVLLLIAGLGLAGFTLARPFLPKEWLP
jgi:hypothetical protein